MKADASEMNNDASGKREVEDKDIMRISVQDFQRYGGRRFTTSLKNFVTPTALIGYVCECPIMGYQT